MRGVRQLSFAVPVLLALAGCTGIPVLPEPSPLPALGRDYRMPTLSDRNPRYVMSFDYLGCVEDSVVSSSGFSGKTSITGTFGARKIVEREFGLAASANFAPVSPGQKVDGIVYVETEKLLVSKSWSSYTASFVFDIEVVALTSAGRQRVFRKKYRVSDASREKGSEDTVPLCVYSCVQQAVRRFVEDLSMCQEISDSVRKH